MPTFGNRARVSTATTGTGTITLGSPVTGLQSFAAAGVLDGNLVRYVIEDGTAWEIGTGVYTASGTTLTRGPIQSSIGGGEITLTGAAQVFLSVAAEDIAQLTDIQEFSTVGTTTWIKPAGALYIHVIMHAGGGGGGSGHHRTNATSSSSRGGAGGGAGGRIEFFLPASSIGASLSLTIGEGGLGGQGRVGTGTGNPGAAGGNTLLDIFVVLGGGGGGGGSSTAASFGQGERNNACFITGNTRYNANGGAGTAGDGNPGNKGGLQAGGGGNGAGNAISTTTARLGGTGGLGGAAALDSNNTTINGGGGAGGSTAGSFGADGADAPDLFFGGSGGGGGGASATALVVGNGGAGGFPGGGGGGGSYGQQDTGGNSAGGGDGAKGAIRITTFF